MGWKWTMLSSVAQLESGHTPSRKHPEYWNEGIPWIGIKDATENHGRTLADTYQHVSALGLQNSSARLLPANTVCLSRTASVGFVVVMGRPMATSQDFVNWVCGPSIEAHYLKYIFLAENEALWRFASGTTHQTIYYPEAKAFHVCLPPLAEQKAIAAVLGALDDKIELNRRMNATLEAMARALFQSWFVDFDPVRAKLEGRPPAALDPATAALFPDSFQDSPLGPIPQGWRAAILGDFVEIVKGRSYRSEDLAESRTALVTLKSFLRGGGYRADGLKPYVGEYKSNQQIQPGDLIVAFTDVTQAADVIGKPALVRSDDRFETLVASLDVGVVRPRSRCVSVPFLYGLFMTSEFQAHTYSYTTGTTVLHLSAAAIPSYVFAVPVSHISEVYSERVSPIFRKIDENTKQSRTLATLRDTLLPKLLSGELSVAALKESMP
jgi:type I restriction enzyme S subunit